MRLLALLFIPFASLIMALKYLMPMSRDKFYDEDANTKKEEEL